MKTLERRLGLAAVIGISMGAMLGSGLFVLPGLAVAKTGASVWLAYLAAGLCVVPAALSKAELATAMPFSGGTYVYIDRTFGPLASTIGGLCLWLSLLLKSAFALVGFGAYLSVLGTFDGHTVGLALLAGIAFLNIFGVGKVAKAQVWIVLIAMASLLVLAAWGATRPHLSAEPFLVDGSAGFLGTISLVYVSYAGVTKIAAVAEEVQNPDRNLPLGMLVSLGIVGGLYAAVTWVMTSLVPHETLAGDLRPVHTLASALGGSGVQWFAGALGVLTMTSMANAGLLAASRFPFAMARDHLLPSPLGKVHAGYKTPWLAILATAASMAAAILFLPVEKIAKLASALVILGFMAECLSVVVLRESRPQWYKPSFRLPLYPVTPILGLLIGLALMIALGWSGLFATLATIVPGFLLFTLFGRNQTDRQGVLGRLGPRREELRNERAELQEFAPEANSSYVVALFGGERSPEGLVEIAFSMAGAEAVDVAHFTDVPDQLQLADMDEDNLQLSSLERRVTLFAEERGHRARFEAFVSRDPLRRVHELSRRVHCEWVLIEWRERLKGGLLGFSPRGWLAENLSCNLAEFKDFGVRVVREILVLAEPGPHDALVATVANELARTHGAHLVFARFVPDQASQIRFQAEVDYIDELLNLYQLEADTRIIRGQDELSALAEVTAGYDLLILGAQATPRWRELLRGTPSERLMRRAACSVLRLKTPRTQTHVTKASPARAQADAQAFRLADHLVANCCQTRVTATGKEAFFTHVAQAFASDLPEADANEIEAALWHRERMQNTAIDRGMGLPHATLASLERTYLGVFTTPEPLDYKAPDGRGVDVFFVTLGPPNDRGAHLQLLEALSRRVLESELLEELRSAADGRALFGILSDGD